MIFKLDSTHIKISLMDKKNAFFLILFTPMMILIACFNTEEKDHKAFLAPNLLSTSADSEKQYRYPLRNNPTTLDPAYSQDRHSNTVINHLFDRLVQFGPYYDVLPALAENWEVRQEGRLYKFFLRSNVVFHNGHPLLADDVVFSLERIIRTVPSSVILPNLLKIKGAREYRSRKSEHVEGIQALNRHVLVIQLTEPHAPLLYALGVMQASIVPKDIVLRDPENFKRHPVGSGPFQFVSWQDQRTIRLARFPNYYAGPAFLNGIDFKIYSGGDIESIYADFLAQKLEQMPVHPYLGIQLDSDRAYKSVEKPPLSLFFYGINCRHPKLRQLGVRKALLQALDWQKIEHEVYKDHFPIAKGILPPGLPLMQQFESTVEKGDENIGFDSALKRKMPRELELVTCIKGNHVNAETEIVRNCFAQIGIDLKVRTILDWKTFIDYVESEEVELFRYQWNADMPDADNFLYPLFGCDSPLNYSRFCDGEVDGLLEYARRIMDPNIRAGLYRKIESRVLAAVPILPLHYSTEACIYQPYVQGVTINGLRSKMFPQLQRVWLTDEGRN